VCTGHIGIFTAKEAKKASHSQVCIDSGKGWRQQLGDGGSARLPEHRHHGEQHQHRAEQRVEEEFERGINAPLSAPDPDDQKHRDQPSLEEHIEEDHVERAEHADHQGLEGQKSDHVFLQPVLHRAPAGEDAERHQEGREDDEQHGNAVHPHSIAEERPRPTRLFDELESRILQVEVPPDQQRDQKGQHRDPKRHVANVPAVDLFVSVDEEEDDCRPCQRKKCHGGENGPGHLARALPQTIPFVIPEAARSGAVRDPRITAFANRARAWIPVLPNSRQTGMTTA
jgi:hypothetical protein